MGLNGLQSKIGAKGLLEYILPPKSVGKKKTGHAWGSSLYFFYYCFIFCFFYEKSTKNTFRPLLIGCMYGCKYDGH